VVVLIALGTAFMGGRPSADNSPRSLRYSDFVASVQNNQIFAGMLPFMGIQVLAIILLYQLPAIGMWLPTVLYR
jgi:TRAP-type mannitol/chloroaromatic compound transport system permease large subunit